MTYKPPPDTGDNETDLLNHMQAMEKSQVMAGVEDVVKRNGEPPPAAASKQQRRRLRIRKKKRLLWHPCRPPAISSKHMPRR